jgi:hypothetical protein
LNQLYQHSIGKSVEGRDIVADSNFDLAGAIRPANITLIIGGLHGDEKATVAMVAAFREQWVATREIRTPLVIIPLANPDGFVANSRYNAHRVDLNRNCDLDWQVDCPEPSGPYPWSEPESQAIRDFIADGPQSTGLARRMWNSLTLEESAPYRIRVAAHERGQPQDPEGFCPGSFGQWCGYGLRFAGGLRPAMITLELPYDPDANERPHPLPASHLADLHVRWEKQPAAYLAATQPAVDKMLAAACLYPR